MRSVRGAGQRDGCPLADVADPRLSGRMEGSVDRIQLCDAHGCRRGGRWSESELGRIVSGGLPCHAIHRVQRGQRHLPLLCQQVLLLAHYHRRQRSVHGWYNSFICSNISQCTEKYEYLPANSLPQFLSFPADASLGNAEGRWTEAARVQMPGVPKDGLIKAVHTL